MAFIKHGDGKILSVVETEEMTDEQKKVAKELTKKVNQQANLTDASDAKKSGR